MRRHHLYLVTALIGVGASALGGCSAELTHTGAGTTSTTAATTTEVPVAETSTSPTSSTTEPTTSATTGTDAAEVDLVAGYGPGQFPPVPLFTLPDVSKVSTAGKALQDKLKVALPSQPGIKVTAVRCAKDGSYTNAESGLSLYGDGSGSYVGADGSYTRGGDGSETSVDDRESVTRDGKGGGTYVGGDLSITNAGDGSGTFVSSEVSVTVDGRGGGTYVSDTESITNDGDGSGTYVAGPVSITNNGDGSGTYVDGRVSIINDGAGHATVVGPTLSGEVAAEPIAPVGKLGKFPPVVQLLPQVDVCGFVVTLADGVLFDFDKDDIRADAAGTLDSVARALKAVGNRPIAISGHTDSIGTDAYNQDLSERRADSVVDALRSRGITAPMTATGYGEKRPVAPNERNGKDDPAGRQLNRRVEIFVKV